MSHDCAVIRVELKRLTEEQNKLLATKHHFDSSPSFSGLIPFIELALSANRKEIQKKRRQLRECVRKYSARPVPLKLSVSGIKCYQQEDSSPFLIDFEDDEPYVLVFSFNIPRLDLSNIEIEALIPDAKVTLIGPWEDVDDDGEFYLAPHNILWGLDGNLARIDKPGNARFVVSLVEHDSSHPRTVRNNVETQMKLKMIEHATAPSRNEFTRRMVDAMSGAVEQATDLAVTIDPDDPIGTAKELRLTQHDLKHAYALGRRYKSLRFAGDDAIYRVYFKLFTAQHEESPWPFPWLSTKPS